MTWRSVGSYVGIFVAVALGIAVTNYGSSRSILAAVSIGSVSGLVAAWFLGRLNVSVSQRLAALGLKDGDYPARIFAIVTLRAEPTAILEACREAIEELPNFLSVNRYDADNGRLEARTRASRMSWGEKISVRIDVHGVEARVIIGSIPTLWTVTEDMRFNYQNVALILRHLQNSLTIEAIESTSKFVDVIRPHVRQPLASE